MIEEAKKVEKKGWYEIAFHLHKQILTIDPHHKGTIKHLKSIAAKIDERLEKLYQEAIAFYHATEINKA